MIIRELKYKTNKRFVYEDDFDTNGILHWIGRNYGRSSKWNNPSSNLLVKVERGKQSEKGSVDDVVGRRKVKECCFLDYFIIDFRDVLIKANKYTLRLDAAYNDLMGHELGFEEDNMGYINNHSWSIKGSNNKREWKIIYEHIDDTTFGNDKSIETATFDIECDDYYRYFKIEYDIIKGVHCSGFEIYGTIKYNKSLQSIDHTHVPKLKSGGNGGGIINLMTPKCRLNDCILSCNGEHGINFGGGGAGGNILIDCHSLEILGTQTRIECMGGKGHTGSDLINMNNDGENGRIRLFCNQIYGDITPQKCCNPQPLIL